MSTLHSRRQTTPTLSMDQLRASQRFSEIDETDLTKLADRYFPHLKGASVEVFIDGSNFHTTTREMGFVVDHEKLYSLIQKSCRTLMGMHYFVAINYDSNGEFTINTKTLDWMRQNGYTVHRKPAKTMCDDSGAKVVKGNMDVEMTVEAMRTANEVSHVILVTGDGDFRRLVQELQSRGKCVTVISTRASARKRVADDLINAADRFVDIEDFREGITRHIANAKDRWHHAHSRRQIDKYTSRC